MTVEVIQGISTLKLDLVASMTLTFFVLIMGYYLRHKVSFFEKFCFPAPVIGGFIFSLVILLLRKTEMMNFTMDTTLQTPFMLAFFTTVGLGASLSLIKKGGKALIIYLVICWSISLIQNGFGVMMAKLLNIHPLLGVMAGAVSLEGGHGAAATFGPAVEQMGVQGAAAVAIAAATFGLISGSLTGGPLARWLIRKNNLAIETATDGFEISYDDMVQEQQKNETINPKEFFVAVMVIGVMMVFGMKVTAWVSALKIPNLFLPGYVGAMFGAILFRNINDKFQMVKMNSRIIDFISDISIGIFLSMAMMSLKIWELTSLALPLIIILVLQVLILLGIAIYVLFPALGKDYDAAVICAGMMGHGLGATPNAVANMNAVCEHYHIRSTKAFLIVPLCGAVLIDFVGIPCITFFISYFGN